MSKEFTLGRAPENEIVLAYPFLSSQHAVITVNDDDKLTFHIKDLGSTNGTFKNGERIEEAAFELSDTILLGSYELQASDILPLYYSNQATRRTSSPKQGKARHLVTGTLLAIIGVLSYLLVSQAPQFSDKLLTERTLIFGLGLWMLLMLLFQLSLSVRRNIRIKNTESAYLNFVTDKWNTQAELALTSQKEKTNDTALWNGFRKFEIQQRDEECKGIVSFYLRPHDGLPLPEFHPGQYLTFKLNIPGKNKPVIRCYSLSDAPRSDYYRVSIKHVLAPRESDFPDGIGSSFFHQQLNQGDIIDVKAPSGNFYLDFARNKPIVLLSGGIGITPMLSMLNTLIEKQLKQEVWFIHGARNSEEQAMKDVLQQIANSHDNISLRILYSKPLTQDKQGTDFNEAGRLNIDYLKQELPSNNYDFYLCGPSGMMAELAQELELWGVPDKDIYSETFGPSKIKAKKQESEASETKAAKPAKIEFARSNKTLQWTGKEENILSFAEENGLELDYGCRAGNCGTCLVALRSGNVKYVSDHDSQPEQGSCLLCIAAPDGDIVLDA